MTAIEYMERHNLWGHVATGLSWCPGSAPDMHPGKWVSISEPWFPHLLFIQWFRFLLCSCPVLGTEETAASNKDMTLLTWNWRERSEVETEVWKSSGRRWQMKPWDQTRTALCVYRTHVMGQNSTVHAKFLMCQAWEGHLSPLKGLLLSTSQAYSSHEALVGHSVPNCQ